MRTAASQGAGGGGIRHRRLRNVASHKGPLGALIALGAVVATVAATVVVPATLARASNCQGQEDGDGCPAITLTKTATPSVVSAPSEISYTFTVANTGDVTVNDLTIDDPKLGGTVPGCATTLTVDHSTTCSGTYSVTQDDIDSGTNIVNQATASGTSSEGSVTSSDSATVTVLQNPKIQLTKLASVSSVSAPGNVTYRLTVQNTGNVTVNNVGVTDPLLSGLISCSPTTLAPDSTGGTDGATATCTMVDPTDSSKTVAPWYSVTQRDIDTMTSIDNEATATAIAANGVDLKSMAKATVPVDQTPGLTLMKSASPSSVAAAGDVVTYSFVLANTGNVTLTDVAVTDRMLSDAGVPVMFNDAAGVPVPCELTLAPGDSETCTAEYPVTAVDIAAGGISNTATASGTEPDDTVYTTPDASTANVSVTVTPPANGGGSTPPPANGGSGAPVVVQPVSVLMCHWNGQKYAYDASDLSNVSSVSDVTAWTATNPYDIVQPVAGLSYPGYNWSAWTSEPPSFVGTAMSGSDIYGTNGNDPCTLGTVEVDPNPMNPDTASSGGQQTSSLVATDVGSSTTVKTAVLAHTGSNVEPLIALVVLVMALGGALVVVSRRREPVGRRPKH